MPSHAHGAPQPWHFSTGIATCLFVVVLIYLRGLRCENAGRLSSVAGQSIAFVTGIVALWAAIASPLAKMHHELLTVHMVQHLLLMVVAAPLILLGDPVRALRTCLPQTLVENVWKPIGRWPTTRLLGGILAHPVVCWLASIVVVLGWHVPAMLELTLQSEVWHGVAQTSFLLAGLLFWWPVIQPWPGEARSNKWIIPLYLFLATLPCDVLSAFLTFSDRVLYPNYRSTDSKFKMSPLEDQETAGALMWVAVTFIYLIPAFGITMRILSPLVPSRYPIPDGVRDSEASTSAS